MAFNLTAQLNLVGPNNIKPIVNSIKQQLGTIKANVVINISKTNSAQITALAKSIKVLDTNLRSLTTTSHTATASLRGLSQVFSSFNSSSSNTGASLAKVAKGAAAVQKSVSGARTEMEEFGRISALAVRRFAAFSIATGAIFGFIEAVKEGVQTSLRFDKEMVRLSQVTGSSVRGLKDLKDEITNLSVKFGVSSEGLLDVSSTLAQAGLSAKETKIALEALAKSTLAPSFDNLKETTEGVIAAMRQFSLEAKDVDAALGSINAVAAAFAVESKDIIAAIRQTGGVFAAASKGVAEGTDALNQFISLFTSVRQTTRESAEAIATGLRTIFTRTERFTTIQYLKQFGIELTDLQGKFVGPYEAVKRLAAGLKSLDSRDIRFAQVVEELGGYRQIGRVIPLIQQFAVAEKALGIAQRGTNSLTTDAAIAQQALLVQITKVKEQFAALIRSISDSAGFRTLITLTLQLSQGLLDIGKALEPLLPYLAILGGVKVASASTQFISGFLGGIKRGGGSGAVGSNIAAAATGTASTATASATSLNTQATVANTAAITALTSALQVRTAAHVIHPHTGGFVSSSGTLQFATGGLVPGSGNTDSVRANLTPGEYVLRKSAVQALGVDNVASMNKYADGGNVSGVSDASLSKFFQKNGFKLGKPEYTRGDISSIREGQPDLYKQLVALYSGGKPQSASPRELFDTGKGDIRVSQLKLGKGILPSAKDILVDGSYGGLFFQLGTKTLNTGPVNFSASKLGDANVKKLQSMFGSVGQIFGQPQQFFITKEHGDAFNKIASDTLNIAVQKILDAGGGADKITSALHMSEPTLVNTLKKQIGIDSIAGGLFEGYIGALGRQVSEKHERNFDFHPVDAEAFGKLFGNKVKLLKFADAKLTNESNSKKSLVFKAINEKLATNTPDIGVHAKLGLEDARTLIRARHHEVSNALLEQAGYIKTKYATGGSVDSVPAMLTPGEFVINKTAASRIGLPTLNRLNHADKVQHFAYGGYVPPGGIPRRLSPGTGTGSVLPVQSSGLITIPGNPTGPYGPFPPTARQAFVSNAISHLGSIGPTAAFIGAPVLQSAIGEKTRTTAGIGSAVGEGLAGAAAGGAIGGPAGAIIGGFIGALNGYTSKVKEFDETDAFKKIADSSNALDKAFREFEKSGSIEALNKAIENTAASLSNFAQVQGKKYSTSVYDTNPNTQAREIRGRSSQHLGFFDNVVANTEFGHAIQGILPAKVISGAINRANEALEKSYAEDAQDLASHASNNLPSLLGRASKAFTAGRSIDSLLQDKNYATAIGSTDKDTNIAVARLRTQLSGTKDKDEQGRLQAAIESQYRAGAAKILGPEKERIDLDQNLANATSALNKELVVMSAIFEKFDAQIAQVAADAEKSGIGIENISNSISGNFGIGRTGSTSDIFKNSAAHGYGEIAGRLNELAVPQSLSNNILSAKALSEELPQLLREKYNTGINQTDLPFDQAVKEAVDSLGARGVPISDTVTKALRAQAEKSEQNRKSASGFNVDEEIENVDRLLKNLPDFAPHFIKYLEELDAINKRYTDGLNHFVQLQLNANEKYLNAIELGDNQKIAFAKLTNKTLSIDQLSAPITNKIGGLTGGLTSAGAIGGNISALQAQYKALSAQVANPAISSNLAKDSLKDVSIALAQNTKALEILAEDTTKLSAIQEKLAEENESRQAGRGLIERVFTASPQERRQLALQNIAYNTVANKPTAAILNSTFAQAAFAGLRNRLSTVVNPEQREQLTAQFYKNVAPFAKNLGVRGPEDIRKALEAAVTEQGGSKAEIALLEAFKRAQEEQLEAKKLLANLAQQDLPELFAKLAAQFDTSIKGLERTLAEAGAKTTKGVNGSSGKSEKELRDDFLRDIESRRTEREALLPKSNVPRPTQAPVVIIQPNRKGVQNNKANANVPQANGAAPGPPILIPPAQGGKKDNAIRDANGNIIKPPKDWLRGAPPRKWQFGPPGKAPGIYGPDGNLIKGVFPGDNDTREPGIYRDGKLIKPASIFAPSRNPGIYKDGVLIHEPGYSDIKNYKPPGIYKNGELIRENGARQNIKIDPVLKSSMNQFKSSVETMSDAIAKFPSKIDINGAFTVNVVGNIGSNAGGSITDELRDLVTKIVRQHIGAFGQTKERRPGGTA